MIRLAILLLMLAPARASAAQGETTRGAEAVRAWELHRRATEESPWPEATWVRMGPKNCGGRIEAVDSPVGQPGTIYAGIGTGGVFKSVNGGLSWEHVFAREATCSIGDVSGGPERSRDHLGRDGRGAPGRRLLGRVGVYRSRTGEPPGSIGVSRTARALGPCWSIRATRSGSTWR